MGIYGSFFEGVFGNDGAFAWCFVVKLWWIV